jgi:hypothetical protein
VLLQEGSTSPRCSPNGSILNEYVPDVSSLSFPLLRVRWSTDRRLSAFATQGTLHRRHRRLRHQPLATPQHRQRLHVSSIPHGFRYQLTMLSRSFPLQPSQLRTFWLFDLPWVRPAAFILTRWILYPPGQMLTFDHFSFCFSYIRPLTGVRLARPCFINDNTSHSLSFISVPRSWPATTLSSVDRPSSSSTSIRRAPHRSIGIGTVSTPKRLSFGPSPSSPPSLGSPTPSAKGSSTSPSAGSILRILLGSSVRSPLRPKILNRQLTLDLLDSLRT